MKKIQLIPVTDSNRSEVLKLSIKEEQAGFVESVAQCLKEARQSAVWRPVGIYDSGRLIGFAMYCLWKEDLPHGRVWLDRFLIDRREQGKGYGTVVLPILMEHILSQYRCSRLYLSVVPENKPAIRLYQKFGFRFTGESDWNGELVMAYQKETVKSII